jgi:hypothetical protein
MKPVSSLIVILLAAFGSSCASPDGAAPGMLSAEMIVARFERAYKACGLTPAFSPTVEIRTLPSLISYSTGSRTITIGEYYDLPPPLKDQLVTWAGPLAMEDGKAVFETIFQRLGVAHEMGHWQQHLSRRFFTLDRWESETEANRIAIAFWSLRGEEYAGLSEVVEGWIGVMGELPDPTPEGADPRAFLQENYRDIVVDPEKYGWFQGQFLKEAWEKRNEADFCRLARVNTSLPATAFAGE